MAEEQKPPTKEEVINFFKEQIEVKTYQSQLQDLDTKIATARAEELRALSFIAQMTNPKAKGNEHAGGDVQTHTVTQEDLDNNPELQEAGVEVGEEILIPSTKEERKLKKK